MNKILIFIISMSAFISFGIMDAIFELFLEYTFGEKLIEVKFFNEISVGMICSTISTTIAILIGSYIHHLMSKKLVVFKHPVMDALGVLLGKSIIIIIYLIIRNIIKYNIISVKLKKNKK